MTTCRGKRRYDAPEQARRILDKARDCRKRGQLSRQERRTYLCQYCKGWHVTSERYRSGEDAA